MAVSDVAERRNRFGPTNTVALTLTLILSLTTGANLTLTILLRMFELGVFDRAVEIILNWDGASDNVNKTVMKVLCWFLISAEACGWPLRKVRTLTYTHLYFILYSMYVHSHTTHMQLTLLRLQVGHTHDLLDASWGILSQVVYGRHSRGESCRDILDWKGRVHLHTIHTHAHIHTYTRIPTHAHAHIHTYTHTPTHTHMHMLTCSYTCTHHTYTHYAHTPCTHASYTELQKVCKVAFRERLQVLEHIKGCFDWDSFVPYSIPALNTGHLKRHHTVELTVKDGIVYSRSKEDMNAATPWSESQHFFPPFEEPDLSYPDPDQTAPTVPLGEWNNMGKVYHDMKKFYNGQLSHVVTDIPVITKQGKMHIHHIYRPYT